MHEKDLAKDVAEDVLGAAKDGNVKLLIVKVLILPVVICQVVNVFIIILPIAPHFTPQQWLLCHMGLY